MRGSGAEAAGSCSLSSSPFAAWRGERELQVPAGGVRGWWRGPLCAAGRGRGEGPTFFQDLVFLGQHLLWGYDYDNHSAVRQWCLLCVWVETLFHLGKVPRDTSLPPAISDPSAAELTSYPQSLTAECPHLTAP